MKLETFKINVQKDPYEKWKKIGEHNRISIKTSLGQFDIFVYNGTFKISITNKAIPLKNRYIDINDHSITITQ